MLPHARQTSSNELPARPATDWVVLGKSGVHVTRLGLGTGSEWGRTQRDLGQDAFTRLVRHAYDRGIRFFDTAEGYDQMHKMLGAALKGIPRHTYRLMSKLTTRPGANPVERIAELCTLACTDYFDIVLMHCQQSANWPSNTARWQEAFMEAKSKGIVRGYGASVHGLPALQSLANDDWAEVAMVRMNHKGMKMDTEPEDAGPADVTAVIALVEQIRKRGMGVISMKLVGEGVFTSRDDRKAAMRTAFGQAGVDCVTVGYKNEAEVDEAIENLNTVLA